MMKIVSRIFGKCVGVANINLSKLFPTRGRVLMLHWVGNETLDEEYDRYRISIQQFKFMLKWLKQKNTIRLENWAIETDFYALTIDDVPESFYTNAYPLLKEYAIPFTIFVNTSMLGKEGYINRDQLREMAQCELSTIGSHGIRHDFFTSYSKADALRELADSRAQIENIINKPVDIFAFPYGSYYACGYRNKHLAAKVYDYAFGTINSPITAPSLFKKYFLPRINVDEAFLKSINEDSQRYNTIL